MPNLSQSFVDTLAVSVILSRCGRKTQNIPIWKGEATVNEYERRLGAIRRVTQGEAISKVCTDLGRSRPWYYKWRTRYRQHGLTGLQDQRPGHGTKRQRGCET